MASKTTRGVSAGEKRGVAEATRPFLLAPEKKAEARPFWQRVAWDKLALFVLTVVIFLLAINLMKEGARDLAPLVRDRFAVDNPANSLGFGWLFSYVIMSGSPVAAAALTFFDAGIVDKLGAFTMITGSRLGASFIVLFIGFIYVLRGRSRVNSLSMGLLSLVVTGTVHVAALGPGLALLASGLVDPFQLQGGLVLTSVTEVILQPLAAFLLEFLPRWSLFIVGLGLIIVSFQLFDRCIPQMSLRESQFGQLAGIVYRPPVMFVLGALVTLISMSVSVSLSLLVPLGDRGFVRRENVIPYIMSAGVTTFVDTLLAAVLLDNPPAFTIVLVEMISIALISLLILLFIYRYYQQVMLALVEWITADNRHLAFFMIAIFVTPLILLFF